MGMECKPNGEFAMIPGRNQPVRLLPIIVLAYCISFPMSMFLGRSDNPGSRSTAIEVLYESVTAPEYPFLWFCAPALNIPFWLGIYCLALQKWQLARGFAAASLLVAALVPSAIGFLGPATDDNLSLGPAYWAWLTSMVLLLLASLSRLR